MCWNLALTYGLDAADEFLPAHRSLTDESLGDQAYWDLVTVFELVHELDPRDWARFGRNSSQRSLAVQGSSFMHSEASADSSLAAPAMGKPVSYKGRTKGGPRMLQPPLGW
jgi:hypothetical protein